jgi:hypothetical protein
MVAGGFWEFGFEIVMVLGGLCILIASLNIRYIDNK